MKAKIWRARIAQHIAGDGDLGNSIFLAGSEISSPIAETLGIIAMDDDVAYDVICDHPHATALLGTAENFQNFLIAQQFNDALECITTIEQLAE